MTKGEVAERPVDESIPSLRLAAYHHGASAPSLPWLLGRHDLVGAHAPRGARHAPAVGRADADPALLARPSADRGRDAGPRLRSGERQPSHDAGSRSVHARRTGPRRNRYAVEAALPTVRVLGTSTEDIEPSMDGLEENWRDLCFDSNPIFIEVE